MKRSLIGLLGGGSRKLGLFVCIALIGAVPLVLGRITWTDYVQSLSAVAIAVSLAIGLEDYGAKRSKAGPAAVAISHETTNNAAAPAARESPDPTTLRGKDT